MAGPDRVSLTTYDFIEIGTCEWKTLTQYCANWCYHTALPYIVGQPERSLRTWLGSALSVGSGKPGAGGRGPGSGGTCGLRTADLLECVLGAEFILNTMYPGRRARGGVRSARGLRAPSGRREDRALAAYGVGEWNSRLGPSFFLSICSVFGGA